MRLGSKEALYAEALDYYLDIWGDLAWGRFLSAPTAREAAYALLIDPAAALTGSAAAIPLDWMMTLSAVGSEGHGELGAMVDLGTVCAAYPIAGRPPIIWAAVEDPGWYGSGPERLDHNQYGYDAGRDQDGNGHVIWRAGRKRPIAYPETPEMARLDAMKAA
jgi:hypothetical protein